MSGTGLPIHKVFIFILPLPFSFIYIYVKRYFHVRKEEGKILKSSSLRMDSLASSGGRGERSAVLKKQRGVSRGSGIPTVTVNPTPTTTATTNGHLEYQERVNI